MPRAAACLVNGNLAHNRGAVAPERIAGDRCASADHRAGDAVSREHERAVIKGMAPR
jgi:hypothetical protein